MYIPTDSDFDFSSRSNQCWMKLRTTVQLSNAIQKPKPPLKREDSFLKRFSTRQIPDTQETMDTGDEYEVGDSGQPDDGNCHAGRRPRCRRKKVHHSTVVNPDSNLYFYWLLIITCCVLYNLWTLIVRQSFPELQENGAKFWFFCDYTTDTFIVLDILVQFRTGYLEQGLMVYNSMKLAGHYVKSRAFMLDIISLLPLDLLYFKIGVNPMLRFPRFLKELMETFNIPTLQHRRDVDVVFLLKLIKNEIKCADVQGQLGFRTNNMNTRNKDIFTVLKSKTNIAQNSPLSRCMTLCNILANPPFNIDVLNESPASIKSKLLSLSSLHQVADS
ncbi:hypothetical protein M8J77_002908 [Diaphorina citri]|nr:hypothetical protein M8J77_002908 [Diaphorina citri]